MNMLRLLLILLAVWLLLQGLKGLKGARCRSQGAQGCWPYPKSVEYPNYIHPWWAQYHHPGWTHAYKKDGVWHPYRYSYWW